MRSIITRGEDNTRKDRGKGHQAPRKAAHCLPKEVSLTVEKLYIINLDILLSVLYRWRSLEATVKIKLKTRSRRLKSKA